MNLLSIAAGSSTDSDLLWVIAATLPPLILMLAKKRKASWFQKLILRTVMKRNGKRKKSEWGTFFLKLLICLGIFGLMLLFLDFGIAAALMLGIGWIIMNV